MEEFQGLPSNSVPPCLTSWETGALHKIDGIMSEEKYVDTLKQYL
jgi:hypothetical protein